MAQFRVGCVPYVNARPLVAAFDQPNEFVKVLYAVPSKLPAMLDSGEVEAILVSSIELLRRNDLLPVTDVGIMSNGPVMSVRLLSKVPLTDIRTLALDQSSMTSNMLAQVILAEQGVFPKLEALPPVAAEMLANHDACVLIGDRGFEADGTGLIDIDLGEAWTKMTGLPFVWALWLGKKDRPLGTTLLGKCLRLAYDLSGFDSVHRVLDGDMALLMNEERRSRVIEVMMEQSERRKFVIDSALQRSTWSSEQVENYLSKGVRFFDPRANVALRMFAELITKHGLAKVDVPIELQDDELYDRFTKMISLQIAEGKSSKSSRVRTPKAFSNIDWVPFQSLEGMVRLVLITEWDPIGVFGYPQTLDEYDDYVLDIAELLKQGATTGQIASHLNTVAESQMGMRSSAITDESTLAVAKKLVNLSTNFENQ